MLVIVASPSFPHTLVMHCLNYELTVLPKIYHCLTQVSVYLAMQITCISHTATRDRNLKKKNRNQQIFPFISYVYIATSGFAQPGK